MKMPKAMIVTVAKILMPALYLTEQG